MTILIIIGAISKYLNMRLDKKIADAQINYLITQPGYEYGKHRYTKQDKTICR